VDKFLTLFRESISWLRESGRWPWSTVIRGPSAAPPWRSIWPESSWFWSSTSGFAASPSSRSSPSRIYEAVFCSVNFSATGSFVLPSLPLRWKHTTSHMSPLTV
jgi:hypothetical protein